MKKVLLSITKSNWGGAQKYVFDLATGLKNKNYDVCVVVGGNGPLYKKLINENIRIISLENLKRDISLFKEIHTFLNLLRIFKTEKPNIIHLNSSKIGGLGSVAAFLYNLITFKSKFSKYSKVIFTIHGWAFNEERNVFSKLFIKLLYFIISIFSQEMIAVSKATKEQAPFGYGNKITVIKNGIKDINFLPPQQAINELAIKESPEIYRIVTIAELHKVKGLVHLIKAVSKIEEVNLFIIGEGDERENLEKYISENKLNKKVFLLGHKDDAGKYLKAFHIFVLPSISEALGIVLLEAGLASLPVIASSVGGIKEIISPKITGLLCPPKQSACIREKIYYILNDKAGAQKMANNLHKFVEDNFKIDRMIDETINLYNR